MASNLDEYFVEEKSSTDKLLDFLVFIAVFAVTIFLLIEVFATKTNVDLVRLGEVYFYVNIVVFVIFSADLIRLRKESNSTSDFFKNNWLDILATIPFGLIANGLGPTFEILKLAKLTKLTAVAKVQKIQKISRISKIGKEFKAASHLKKESENYKKKHRL